MCFKNGVAGVTEDELKQRFRRIPMLVQLSRIRLFLVRGCHHSVLGIYVLVLIPLLLLLLYLVGFQVILL